jgi:hypothetical protein
MALLKKHHLFIMAAIATILVAIAMDYMVPDIELFSESLTDTSSPSTFTDYKLPLNEFTTAQKLSMPIPVIGAGNVWSNYNRDDYGVFTYSPFEPHNEQNEDVLHYGDDHRQAELRAIFQKKYCFNGQMKLTGQASSSGPSPLDAVDVSILSKLSFPADKRKCNPCSEKCEFTIMDSERKLATEEFLVRPKGVETEEMYARLEQAWTRVFHGVREIFI